MPTHLQKNVALYGIFCYNDARLIFFKELTGVMTSAVLKQVSEAITPCFVVPLSQK